MEAAREIREGDWQCPNEQCINNQKFPQFFVYGTKFNCPKCGTGRTAQRPGDWTCPNVQCVNHTNCVYATKTSCHRCGTPRPAFSGSPVSQGGGPAQAGWSGGSHYAAASQGGPQNGGRPGDWHCGTEGCKNNSVNLVYGSKANCPLCGGEKPDVPVQPKPRWAADSRWATDAAVSVAPSPEAAAASEEKAVALETAEAQLRAAGLDSEADKLAQQAAEHRAAAATLESAAVQAAAAEEKAAALEASAAQLHAAGLVAEASQLQQQAAEHRRPHVVPPARGRPAWSGGVPPPPAAPHPGFAGAYGRGRGDAHHWPPPPHGGKGHGKGKDGKGGGHPGDWHCANPECKNYQDNVVFASKQACPICGTPKPMIGVGYPNKRSENDWQCPNTTCKNHTNFVYGSKPACTICGMPNPNLEGGAAERDHSRTPRGDHGDDSGFTASARWRRACEGAASLPGL